MSKSIAVFGAGPGLGQAVARRYAREGYAVTLVGRRPEPLDHLAKDLTSAGATAHVITADLSDTGATPRLAEQIRAKAGNLDAFYYAPTPATGFVSAANLTPQHAQNFMPLIFYTMLALVQEFLPHMLEQGGRRHPDRTGRQHRAGPAEHERPQSCTSRPAQLPASPARRGSRERRLRRHALHRCSHQEQCLPRRDGEGQSCGRPGLGDAYRRPRTSRRPALDYARHEGTAGSHLSVVPRAVDPFPEGLVAVFPQIRQFLSRLLDPLELEGIDPARPGFHGLLRR